MVATHGRQEEADKVMANIEEAVRRSGQELAPIDESKAIEIVPLTSVGGQAVPAASAAPTAA